MSESPAPTRSLSRKITLPLVLVGTCLAALGVAGIYAIVSSHLEARLRLRAQTIAQSIAYAAENIDREGELQRIVSATGAEREVSLLLVSGGYPNAVVASSNPTWRKRPLELDFATVKLHRYEEITQATWSAIGLDPRKPPADWLVVSLPLQLHNLEVNTIDLYPAVVLVALDTTATRADVWRLTAWAAVGFSLTLVALSTLYYLNLRRLVLRPLSELAQRHLGAPGPSPRPAATVVDPADEIGQLDAALTRTFTAINAARIERDHIEFAFNQHVIVAATDPRGRIIYANDRFCNVSGYSRQELLGQDHRIVNSGHHPREFFADLYKTIQHAGVWHGEICNRTKSGKLYWVDTTIVPELDSAGKPVRYVALRSDITERKAAEAELMETNSQLNLAIDRANQLTLTAEMATIAKADFLANMSHEIRTPMNGVIGMLSLLIDSPLSEEQRQFATVANASGETLLTLINDILDFSKIEAGRLTIESIDLDLQQLLASLMPLFELRANEKHLALIQEIQPTVPTLLVGDPVRLRQVITNLMTNALKFTTQGEVKLSITAPRITPTEVILRFTVTDTGVGIPDDKLGLLFNKFSQVDASTTRKYGGTGLGLAICKQLAELMGGEVGVNSQVGQGSEFWFTARLGRQPPRARRAAGGSLSSSSAPCGPLSSSSAPVLTPPPKSPTAATRILLTDDNTTNQLVAASL
jgi:PAS domain S-box-containing protein